jgi:hypothetical protein
LHDQNRADGTDRRNAPGAGDDEPHGLKHAANGLGGGRRREFPHRGEKSPFLPAQPGDGALPGIDGDVGAKRWALSGGWFVTANVVAKVEYVNQKYVGFPPTHIKNGGHFKGLMAEGVIGF